jgi:hypothetical protein
MHIIQKSTDRSGDWLMASVEMQLVAIEWVCESLGAGAIVLVNSGLRSTCGSRLDFRWANGFKHRGVLSYTI